MSHHIKPRPEARVKIDRSPQSAGRIYHSFRVVTLGKGEFYTENTGGWEVALVQLVGNGRVVASGKPFTLPY